MQPTEIHPGGRPLRARSVLIILALASLLTLLPLAASHGAGPGGGQGSASEHAHGGEDDAAHPPGALQREIAQVRAAVAKYHTPERVPDSWELVPGLDHCFDNPGVGAMGVHYIDTDLFDKPLDPLHPEALVFVPGPNGQLRLGAVEYIVPAEPWDLENDHPPSVLGQHLHLNEALGVYVLHVWLFEPNPAGMFEDWNPRVSCDSFVD
jgi:hypothetical protein